MASKPKTEIGIKRLVADGVFVQRSMVGLGLNPRCWTFTGFGVFGVIHLDTLGMWFTVSALGVVVAIGLRSVRRRDEEDAADHPSAQATSSDDGTEDAREQDGFPVPQPLISPIQFRIVPLYEGPTADKDTRSKPETMCHTTNTSNCDSNDELTENTVPNTESNTEPQAGQFIRKSLLVSDLFGQTFEPPVGSAEACPVVLAQDADETTIRSRFQTLLDWPHWTSAMWVSLLLCLGTCIGLAWYDSPSNTAVLPAGEIGTRATSASADRTAAMFQHLRLGQSENGMTLAQVPIRDIKVGTRAPALNPEVTAKERAGWVEPRWEEWLQLSLLLPKDDGSNLEIEILRPEWWVVQQFQFHYEEAGLASDSSGTSIDEIPLAIRRSNDPSESFAAGYFGGLEQYFPEANSAEADAIAAAISCQLTPLRPAYHELAMAGLLAEASGLELVGATVEMDLPELGAVGPALVVDLKPCPAIPAGPGQVITATFKHASADVIDLVLSDYPVSIPHSGLSVLNPPTTDPTSSPETIGVTGNHPFWSLDRAEFVLAGGLVIGERLQTLSGDIRWVQQKLPRPGPEPVYNLEVHGEHVYYVGDSGVLAHNASCVITELARITKEVRGFVTRGLGSSIAGRNFASVRYFDPRAGRYRVVTRMSNGPTKHAEVLAIREIQRRIGADAARKNITHIYSELSACRNCATYVSKNAPNAKFDFLTPLREYETSHKPLMKLWEQIWLK